MMNQKLIKTPVLLLLFLLTTMRVSAANETLKTGAFNAKTPADTARVLAL